MLNRLQASLEQLYDVSTPHRVEDFVVHDPRLAAVLAQHAGAPYVPEQLFVVQSGDNVDLALFLEAALMERLGQDNPQDRLHPGNLGDFCTALEGVSHFLYLVWNAHFERPITAFELELQAEVDKFVVSAAILRDQAHRSPLRPLWHRLFAGIRFRAELGPAERERYETANRLAAMYCRTLDFGLEPENPAMIRELRRFYRLPRRAKVRHIEDRSATPG
jgi:hypothetical protein